MKKFLIILFGTLLLSAGVLMLLISDWRQTPYGQLTTPAAIIAKLATWQETGSSIPTAQSMRDSRRGAISLVSGPPIAMQKVRNLQIAGPEGSLPVRIYTPSTSTTALPIIVYFHGGGWVLGDLDSHDNLCRTLAAKADAIVVAVDYRLAPESIYPAALNDANTALHWAVANAQSFNGDPARIAVAGDSAGGNLAAALSLLERDQQGTSIAAQVLIYPAVDLSNLDRPSALQFAKGLFLTRERMAWFIAQYVPDKAARSDPLVSPLLAKNLHNLPPTLIITAEFDPLRDEGEAYAAALKQSGVTTEQQRFDGVLHGFASMDRWFPEADQATDLIAAFLDERFKAVPSRQ